MPPTEQAPVQVTDRFIHLPQGRLFVRSWQAASGSFPGAGAAPIVLFHDSLGCVALWRDFPAALAAATGRRVIAYDRLGFGRSDPHGDRLAPGFVAAEADAALPALQRELGFGRFVAFGHSVGGGMAVHCAARHPDECLALVTESAQAFVEERTLAGIREARTGFQEPARFERLARHHGKKARWVLDAWTETWLAPSFRDWSLADVLPHVACPVLALHGEHDEFGTARHPDTIVRLAGGPARREIIAGAFHVPHREQPALVLRLASDFLAAHAA